MNILEFKRERVGYCKIKAILLQSGISNINNNIELTIDNECNNGNELIK